MIFQSKNDQVNGCPVKFCPLFCFVNSVSLLRKCSKQLHTATLCRQKCKVDTEGIFPRPISKILCRRSRVYNIIIRLLCAVESETIRIYDECSPPCNSCIRILSVLFRFGIRLVHNYFSSCAYRLTIFIFKITREEFSNF